MMFLSYDIIQLHLMCLLLCFWVLLILIHFKGLWINGGANCGRSVSVCLAVLVGRGVGCFSRTVVVKHTRWSCAFLPTSGFRAYCNTWPRVSGNFVARKLPAARAPAANMIGTALVMPTNDWKMLMPKTAASLQRAFRKPKAVVLEKKTEDLQS